MSTALSNPPLPDAASDWINLTELAGVLGISPRTAQARAQAGLLARFEHGFGGCGRRRYSRVLVERERLLAWQRALRRQDDELGVD